MDGFSGHFMLETVFFVQVEPAICYTCMLDFYFFLYCYSCFKKNTGKKFQFVCVFILVE